MDTITKGKMLKRKKQLIEFGADNIDSTAPVKKVLDNLQHKHIPAFAFYCQLLRPRRIVKKANKTFHFTLTGHPIYAFPDDWEGDLNSRYFERFSYKSLMPKIITPLSNIQDSDPVSATLRIKREWEEDSKSLRKVAVRINLLDKYENLNEEVVSCPKQIVDIAAQLDSDPDPYFNDSYNWYYAGNGNMLLICVDLIDYILYSKFSTLYLTQFSSQEVTVNNEHTATFDCEEGNNIMETICSTYNMVALRTKNKIVILKITCVTEKIEFEKIKQIESELPFTNISFDCHHNNILYVTSLNNKVTIVNLERLTGRTVKLKSTSNSLVNNWNMVMSADRVTYTHITKNSINTYDKRTNNICVTWCDVRQVTDHLTCNDISVAKQWEGNSLYFGTDHHLFLMDLRYQNEARPKVIQRWTHGMQCLPTFISKCNFGFQKELICLSSQWCEDTCVVSNYDSNSREAEISSVTLPYRLPSLLTTLNEARQKSFCLDLHNPIDTRLSSSITGQAVLENDENYIILMQNSLGDISYCTLYPEHMEYFENDNSIQHLHEWCKPYRLENERKKLEVSSIEDISRLWKSLKKVHPSLPLHESVIPERESRFSEKEIYDIFEKEELDSGLLDAWTNKADETKADDTSISLNLHYTEDSIKM